MTFVRLAGCNGPGDGLGCTRWCDTPECWDPEAGQYMSVPHVADAVTMPRVCVTGGEPLLQPDGLASLVTRLHGRGARVHLETNGSRPSPGEVNFDWVTVSPKPPQYAVHPTLCGRVDELKFVVDRDFGEATVRSLAEAHPRAVVCLQPEASEGTVGMRRAVELVLKNPAWRLSLQLHKVLGIE